MEMAQPDGKAERDAQIYGRRNDGLTLAAIGLEFGLAKETVRVTVRLVERKAMWRAIDRNAERERLAPLRHAVGKMGASFKTWR
jgi:hypothetical protein